MAIWREIKYYARGTPTKTTKRLRRRHLFAHDETGYLTNDSIRPYHSPCGLSIFTTQMSEGPTDSQKCKSCLKAIAARRRKG